ARARPLRCARARHRRCRRRDVDRGVGRRGRAALRGPATAPAPRVRHESDRAEARPDPPLPLDRRSDRRTVAARHELLRALHDAGGAHGHGVDRGEPIDDLAALDVVHAGVRDRARRDDAGRALPGRRRPRGRGALARATLTRMYTDDAAVLALARPLLALGAAFQLFDALQIIAAGALRGAGDTRWPFLTSTGAAWVIRLPLAWLFAVTLGGGVVGAWYAEFAFILSLAALLMWRFRSGA